MKNISIFYLKHFFFHKAFLKKVTQSVYYSISFFLIIINLKKLIKERLGLLNLSKAEIFYICKTSKIIQIDKNKNLIFITL